MSSDGAARAAGDSVVTWATADIEEDLATLEGDQGLLAEDTFAARTQAQETLEAEILARIAALEARGVSARALRGLRRRAGALQDRCAAVDAGLFARLRDDIRRGELRGDALQDVLLYLAPPPEDGSGPVGYDALDALVSGVLLDESPPITVRPELRGWEPEMVPYQPTPARIVFELAARLRPGAGEVFYDLGSGLGQVCVLVHLLTGIRAVGIEIDPALCTYGERVARRLGLREVTFAVTDAREADLTPGTLFFLYTPFTGTLLEAVMARLREVAARHAIRLASYGPCTAVVARQGWLSPEGQAHDDPGRVVVFRSG